MIKYKCLITKYGFFLTMGDNLMILIFETRQSRGLKSLASE